MKYIILLLISIVCAVQAAAQGYSIQGTVIGANDNSPLPGATVILLSLPDSAQAGTATDVDGNFRFMNLPAGRYLLRASYIGFNEYRRTIDLNNDQFLGSIPLQASATQLGEVEIVDRIPPSTQSGDTTIYNSGAFKTNPNADAEELIRKLPGVTVQDGKVQAQGENVREVLVDGKPFFGEDPNAVLKNLPAELIDKIQIFDKQSEQSEHSGFNDGNTSKTINIITKQNMRNGTFGKIYGGYGIDDEINSRYNAGGSVNFFNEDRRITIIGQSNNINEQNFSTEDLAGVTAQSGGGRGGGGTRGGGGRGGSGGGRSGGDIGDFLVNAREGITNTNAFGINYMDTWSPKLSVNGSYFFNRTNNLADQLLFREFILPTDSSRFYNESSLSQSTNLNHRLNLRMDYKIDSFKSILIRPRLSFQQNEGSNNFNGETFENNELVNATYSDFLSDINAMSFSNMILYRQRFEKRGRTFSVRFSQDYNNTNGDSYLFSENIYYEDLVFADSLNQYSDLLVNGWGLSGNISYTEPLGEKAALQFEYGINYKDNESDKFTYHYSVPTGEYTLMDTVLTNSFSSRYITHQFRTGYRLRGEKSMFMLSATYERANLLNEQYFPTDQEFERSYNYILPMGMYMYNFTKNKNLRIFYRTSANEPRVEQLQDVVVNTNPLFLTTGNPALVPSYQHRMFSRYSASNIEKGTSFFAMLSGTYTQNYIGNSTFIANRDTLIAEGILVQRGAQLSMPVNLDGQYNIFSVFNYAVPFGLIKSNLSFNANASYSRTPGLINNEHNYAHTTAVGAGVVLSSNISENLDFTISTNSSYSVVNNTLRDNLNTTYFSQHSRARLNWIFGNGFTYNTELNHRLYAGLSGGFNENYLLWNMSFGKKILKDDRGEIRLSVNDLLNENTNITRNVTETYIEDVQTNVLQRFYMISFIYNFREFGK